jgi:cytochrome c oxidase subunit 2
VKKFWALVFLSVPVWGVGSIVLAATVKRTGPYGGWWWPEPLSSFGGAIDDYFLNIQWVVAATFILTTGLLGWFMWKYNDETPGPASPTHHNTALEASWSAATALILVLVAAPQVDDFEQLKVGEHMPVKKADTFAEVTGRQFEWRIRYPGADGHLRTLDDVWAPPSHSFFIPALRIKQDAVPGLTIPMWFDSRKAGTFDLVCAELCGWGHYKMRGTVVIHETQAAFDAWLHGQRQQQESDGVVAKQEAHR